jgi:hypothetical protein
MSQPSLVWVPNVWVNGVWQASVVLGSLGVVNVSSRKRRRLTYEGRNSIEEPVVNGLLTVEEFLQSQKTREQDVLHKNFLSEQAIKKNIAVRRKQT